MINSLEQGKKIIKDKIPLIPKNPGVYKMLSSSGEILYIENRAPVARAADQTEDIKLIIEF